MTVSRSARITLLLVIDLVFFFVELIVGQLFCHLTSPDYLFTFPTGYAVGSLALVADSFHMLKSVSVCKEHLDCLTTRCTVM